jgi:nucleoid-associated protein YgaU
LAAVLCGLAVVPSLTAEPPPGEAARQGAEVAPFGDALYDGFRNLHARQQWAESEIARLTELNALLQGENRLLRDQLEILRNQTAASGTRTGDCDARFRELDEGRDQALSANQLLRAEKLEMEGMLESSTLAVADLLRQVETLEAALAAGKAGVDVCAAETGELRQVLARAEGRIGALNQELSVAQATQQEYRLEIDQLKEAGLRQEEQLAQRVLAEDEAIMRAEKAETSLASLEASTTEVNRRVEDLRAALDKAKAESAKLQTRLESQREMHGQALTALEQASAKLRTETKGLRAELLAAREKVADLEASRAEGARSEEAVRAENTRLAAGRAKLETHLARAEEEAVDLKQRIKVLEETHAGAVAAVERLQKYKADIQGELDGKKQALAALGSELESLKRTSDQEVEGLRNELSASRREAERLKGELDSVRSQLPAAAGGSVTDEQLRRDAAEQARALRELQNQKTQMEKGAWMEKRKELETALRDKQFLLARSLSARSVYRVRPDDTLAKISLEVYGSARRWPEIFAANRHLLEDPDRVVPGISLVIP